MSRRLKRLILPAVSRCKLCALLWGWSFAGWTMAEGPTFRLQFASAPLRFEDRQAASETTTSQSEPFARFAPPLDQTAKQPLDPPVDFKLSPGEPPWVRRSQFLSDGIFDETSKREPTPFSATSPLRWANSTESRSARQSRRASWLNFPFQFEKFTGWVLADEPIHRQIHNGQGNLFGGRFGWDFAPRWGVETQRLGARFVWRLVYRQQHTSRPPHKSEPQRQAFSYRSRPP